MKEEKIAEYITEWLRDYLRGSGSRGYVVLVFRAGWTRRWYRPFVRVREHPCGV